MTKKLWKLVMYYSKKMSVNYLQATFNFFSLEANGFFCSKMNFEKSKQGKKQTEKYMSNE